MEPVRIYSTSWCSDCRRAKQFLKERGVQLEEINVDESPDAEDLVLRVNKGRRTVPTFEMNGEFFSCSPFDPYFLSEKFGVPLNP
ncbi:MAG TPA: glutaredoxin domain-containing protein [Candidatus Acidoferrales bacterium]|jgi:mycoredoxin|nr:glutaredoxin domain-containing protein [Candidatus Acidoferrales bacterium]